MNTCCFKNDNNVKIKLFNHPFTEEFKNRDNHEVMFRKIHSYLITNNIIKDNIIDLGAWIGDNSIPWAKQTQNIIYAIDPSPNNIDFINKMTGLNCIENIVTIQKGISDKTEILCTSDDIDHCSFKTNNGNVKIEMVSLDYLYQKNIINKIGYIHLDVEGLEFKVIKGATKIIHDFNPIITFEQHLTIDNYISLSNYLIEKKYEIYLINEVLPGCRNDCRNLIAFPEERKINIDLINNYLGSDILLLIGNKILIDDKPDFSATLYGESMSNKEYMNVFSIKNNDIYLFAVHDNNYTKIVSVDKNGLWIKGKYVLGEINLNCSKTIINAYKSSQNEVNKKQYNIKHFKKLTSI